MKPKRPLTSAQKNDTLNGLLYGHERPEEMHLRHKLGYWQMVETRMVREQLLAEGVPEALLWTHISKGNYIFDSPRYPG